MKKIKGKKIMYHEYEYEFKIDNITIFFTESSKIEFYEDDKLILKLNPWDIDVIQNVYNLMMKKFKEVENESREEI